MKKAVFLLAILIVAFWATAGAASGQAQQNAPAAGQAAPAAKRPPQAKTQPEFDAWKAASANTDPAALEKGADDFATKFPNSELRVLLYKRAMQAYQNADNAAKTEAMGRKVLSCDADDPDALVMVSLVIAEKTGDTDLDRDQRLGEAITMAKKALTTIDTDLAIPAGTPQEKVDAYKSGLRSQAYSILGAIDYKREDYVSAQTDLQKSIDAYPSDPQAVDILRLALALDKQGTAETDHGKQQEKYAEALKYADRAVSMTQDNTPIGTPARRERDRLQQLAGAAPAQPQTPPKN